jgi:hypothetical protein
MSETKAAARAKVQRAAKMTDFAQLRIRAAIRSLQGQLVHVNALGVYLRPADIKALLGETTDVLVSTRRELMDIEWPSDADYDDAGY